MIPTSHVLRTSLLLGVLLAAPNVEAYALMQCVAWSVPEDSGPTEAALPEPAPAASPAAAEPEPSSASTPAASADVFAAPAPTTWSTGRRNSQVLEFAAVALLGSAALALRWAKRTR